MARRKTPDDPGLAALVLEATITRLRAQKNTRALGDLVSETRDYLRRVDRASALQPIEVRAPLFTSIAARITAPRPGAKPPSHLVPLRRQWDWVTRCVKGVKATVPGPATPYRELRLIWREVLAQPTTPAHSTLDRAWDAGDPRAIAWRLLVETSHVPTHFDRDTLRRSLKRVRVPRG